MAWLAVLTLFSAACGSADAADSVAGDDRPTIVATTSILGDVVENLVGDQFEVATIMPRGVDPHDFQPSPRQVAQMTDADVMIINGGGFEEGLVDAISAAQADGTATLNALSAVGSVVTAELDGDPHFFTDPAHMIEFASVVVDFLIEEVPDTDVAELRRTSSDYIDALITLDQEIAEMVDAIPEERRLLVMNHRVFGYFAHRYGFKIAGSVIPAGSTADGVSSGALAALAATMERKGVPAIFADDSSSDALAAVLADEVDGVDVVTLFSESLGPADSEASTYLKMVRTNAERITAALAG